MIHTSHCVCVQMYQSAQSFIINQFGMSMFTLVDGVYEARTFNFNLFPGTFGNLDKRFMCQSSSLAYLAQHNFDFNKMIYEGIPFMTLEQQELMLNVRPLSLTLMTDYRPLCMLVPSTVVYFQF